MKIPRLFVDQPLQSDQRFTLDRDASKYIVRVLRRKEGDKISVFNGDGLDYPATILATGPETEIQIDAGRPNNSESPLNITLVQSLAKGSKLDLIIQKATELGVHRITPVSSNRSVLQIDQSKINIRMNHWRTVAISACTQCQRSIIPSIDEPQSFIQWLDAMQHENTFLLHPQSKNTIGSAVLSGSDCTILVGPEGGFTNDELEKVLYRNIKTISCGPRIMRTETAGFTAIAVLQSLFGDFK